MATLYEIFRRRVEAGASLPLNRLLGIRIEAFEPGFARASLDVTPDLFNPMGSVHGGVYCDLADMAMGISFFCTLAEGEAMTTLELKVNYLRPLVSGRATAEARVVHRGRATGLVECDVFDHAGKLAARFSSTCLILHGEKAAACIRAMENF